MLCVAFMFLFMPSSLGEQEDTGWRLTGQVGGVTKALIWTAIRSMLRPACT